MKNQNLLNAGTFEQVEAKVKKCDSRKEMRLALQAEQESEKPRKTVIELLEKKIKA